MHAWGLEVMRSNGSRAMNSSGTKSRILRDKREEMQFLPHPSPLPKASRLQVRTLFPLDEVCLLV